MIIRVISSAALMAHQIPLIPSYKWKEIIEHSALIDLRIYHCCIFVWVCSISGKRRNEEILQAVKHIGQIDIL